MNNKVSNCTNCKKIFVQKSNLNYGTCTKCFFSIYEKKVCSCCNKNYWRKKISSYTVCYKCIKENEKEEIKNSLIEANPNKVIEEEEIKINKICVTCNKYFKSNNKYEGGCDKCWDSTKNYDGRQITDKQYRNRNIIVYRNRMNNKILDNLGVNEDMSNLILQYISLESYELVI